MEKNVNFGNVCSTNYSQSEKFTDYLRLVMDPKKEKWQTVYQEGSRVDFYSFSYLPFPFANRDLVLSCDFLPDFNGGAATIIFSVERPDHPRSKKAVRAYLSNQLFG